MNLKFYKTRAKPTTVGSLWFNPTTKRIELITGTSTSDVYGSDIQDATYSNDILTIEKIDGSTITINLSGYATSSELENSLANKLNKIKVNNSTVNSADLNIVGSGGTTVSNNSGTITISSETAPTSFDASAITSGTISLARLPKGALERLFIVTTETDAMSAEVQEGDTVQVINNNNQMYFCVNEKATDFSTKFHAYTAGTATSVPWSGVTNAPTIPSKTSDLTNDSGFLTTAPVTSVNGQTGDVTISSGSTPIVYVTNTLTNLSSYSPQPNSEEIREAYYANIPVYIRYDISAQLSRIYKLLEITGTESTQGYYYFYRTTTGFGITCESVYFYRDARQQIRSVNKISSSANDYSLPTADSSTLGGVMIGDGINVNTSGKISVDETVVQTKLVSGTDIKTINGESVLGSGDITISAGTEYTLPKATNSVLGGVIVPTSGNLTVDSSGNIKVPTATSSTLGVVKTGTNISNSDGTISVPTASASTAGVIKVGSGLKISRGTLSTNLTIPTKTSDLTNDSKFLTEIPKASTTDLGGIKVGEGLEISSDGTLTTAEIGATFDPTNIGDNMVPAAEGMYDIGSPSNYWREFFITELVVAPHAAGAQVVINENSSET